MTRLWDAVREGCGSCEFGREGQGTKPMIECCRRPPTMLVVRYSGTDDCVEAHRPWMSQADWCGEWKRKQKAPNEA